MRILIEFWIVGISIDLLKRLPEGVWVHFGLHVWFTKHTLSLELYEK